MEKAAKRKRTIIKLNESNYVERDISWCYFNYRILKEAQNNNVPLYERLSFLGIYSSNLDEFYKVRVATLKRIAENTSKDFKKEKNLAKSTLKKIYSLVSDYSKEYNEASKKVFEELKNKDVILLDDLTVNDEQKEYLRSYFVKNISLDINPLILSKKADFSSVNDTHIYLAIKMSEPLNNKEDKNCYALIALPTSHCGRFISLPSKDNKHYYIYLDDVVRLNLDYIFKNLPYLKFEAYAFKFSKDAEMEIESDPEEGVLKSISLAVKERKKGIPVRVVFGEGMPKDLQEKLIKKLEIDDTDIITKGGKYHNNKDLMKFPRLNIAGLSYPEWPQSFEKAFKVTPSLIDIISKKDILVHVPYESFNAFINVLQEAAISPNVNEIKASIYRAAKDSKVIQALINASKNGKKVTCMVELLARFDESSNILISQTLKDAGVDVLTGKEGFKVHGKIVYIRVKNGKDIAIISTGNFHEGNAKTYTDCLLFTSNPKIVNEVKEIFSYIANPYEKHNFKNLLVSPLHMQSVFERLIKNEIKNHNAGLPSGIKIKINHITDKAMVKLLYEASTKGVKVDLLIRGNSSLVPNLPGVSENISIHAIIDRYLEHSRIFVFENGGNPLVYMGSADWMPRNLYNRIEVITPVYDEDIKKELIMIVNSGLKDNVKGVIANGKDEYERYINDDKPFRSQEELYNYYSKTNK